MAETPPLKRFYTRLSENLDINTWSGRYFGIVLLVAVFRILWVIGQTSGVFGKPVANWIVDFQQVLRWALLIFTLAGLVAHIVVIELRRRSDTNEPLTALVTNAAGALLFLILAERISHVVLDKSPAFNTWAQLLRDGIIQGGVYALIALGYTLVYGILFMINFAHGEVMMMGAYGGWFGLMFLLDNGNRSFEAGSATLAFVVIPILAGILFLPLESIISQRQKQNSETHIADPSWIFTTLTVPIRAVIGGVIGYGAIIALGRYAPQLYLVVITVIGLVFVTLVGMFVSVMVAVTLERIAYRPLRKAPRLTPLITAIGASIFLQQVALRIFGRSAKTYNNGLPKLLSDPRTFNVDLGDLGVIPIPKVGVVIIFVSLSLMALLYFIVRRTKIGRGMRAVAEDKDTAALMGTNVDRTIVTTFILGAALAGAAGVMVGFRGENIGFRFGFTPGLKAFTAAVLGGIGNIPGAMLGGFFLGLVEAIGPTALGFGNEWKNVIAFLILVLVIIYRPTGLLGELAAEKKV